MTWRFIIAISMLAALWVAHGQIFVPSGMRTGVAGTPKSRTFESKNRAYQLVIEEAEPLTGMGAPDVKVNATMVKRDGDAVTNLWSTSFTMMQVQYMDPVDVLVSDAGGFFVITRMVGGTWLHRKEKQVELKISTYPEDLFLSFAENVVSVDQAQGEDIVRIWNRQKGWQAFKASDGGHVNITPEMTAR
jgi:hypothetical protein